MIIVHGTIEDISVYIDYSGDLLIQLVDWFKSHGVQYPGNGYTGNDADGYNPVMSAGSRRSRASLYFEEAKQAIYLQ